MANPIFKKSFGADYDGINGEVSAIEADGTDVNRAVNYERAVGNSLRGRVGCQVTGLTGAYDDVAASTNVFSGDFFGIFPWSYTRTQDEYSIVYQTPSGVYPNQTPSLSSTKTTADGASVNRLIGLNKQCWVLDTMNITVTYVSGTYPFTWYTTVSGGVITFVIKANGSTILSTSLGNGISSVTSIYNLLSTIDALANFSVSRATRGTCPPFAKVNGNQTSSTGTGVPYGDNEIITVDAGHTFLPGDIITFPVTPYQAGFVNTVTATTITYVGQPVTLLDDMILGYMNQAATNFNISTVQTAASGNLTLSFPYWRWIPEGDSNSTTRTAGAINPTFGNILEGPYETWAAKTTGSFYAPAVATNAQGDLYLAATALPGTYEDQFFANNLLKIDGQTIGRAGLPTPTTTATAVVGAGALTGNYKYKAFLRCYDAQGNITDGPVSNVSSVTYAGADYGQIIVTFPDYLDATGFLRRGTGKTNTELVSPTSSFYIGESSSNNAFVQIGDVIILTDNVAQKTGLWKQAFGVDVLGTIHRTRCTTYTGTTAIISPTDASIQVEVPAGSFTVNTNTTISTGLTIVVLRTTVGGNSYYVLCEIPARYDQESFFDNVTDAVLTAGEQYTEVTLGKEHNAPPSCTLVSQHQGGLVVAKGYNSPNTVAFSSADGIEYFPTASNSFDIPSTQSGFITAIASDTNDRLAVFKERAYYDVVGDLDGGVFSINVKNEGDFGITSQNSLVRVSGNLVGLSRNGFVKINDGFLTPVDFPGLNARVINQKLNYAWAVASNDSYNRQYICSIPQITGDPLTYIIDYSRASKRDTTFERSFTTQIDPAGGMVSLGDEFYHLSSVSPYVVFRRLIRFDGDSPENGDGASFCDNTNAITYIMEGSPINFGEPSQFKTPTRILIWSIPNDYVNEGWVPFSMTIETGASPIATYIGSPNPGSSTTVVTFATANDVSKVATLVAPKTKFYLVRLTTSALRTAPFLTGYEIQFVENYVKTDIKI